MSIQTSSASTRSTEIDTEIHGSKSNQSPGPKSILLSENKQPSIEARRKTQKHVHFGEPESTSSPSHFVSGEPNIKARSSVAKKNDERLELTPEMRSVFKNITLGNLAFFDLVPSKRSEQHRHGINLDMVHPKTLHTPLTMALESKQIAIVVMLLVLGADPQTLNGREKSTLDYATPLCRNFLRFFVLRHKPEFYVEKSKPHERFLQWLNTVDAESGETMLSWAVRYGQVKMAGLLLLAGADFSGRNATGAAPLEVAARFGTLQIVDAMLEVWPQLASYAKLPYVKQAIVGAAEMNRPSVIAHLLAFFRAEFRARNEANDDDEDIESIDLHEIIPRNPHTEDEAFEFFMNNKPQPALTVGQLMHRASDNYLLTAKECRLLDLDKAELIARQMGHQRVVDIIAAHTMPRV